MVLISRNGTNCEYIEPRRKDDSKNESSSIAGVAHNKCNYDEDDAQNGSDYSGELRASAKGRGYEKRPASQEKSQEDVHSQDQTDVGESEYTEAPDDADNDPCRKVYERNTEMPGATEPM